MVLKVGDHVRFIPKNIDELKKNNITGWENLTGVITDINGIFFCVEWDNTYEYRPHLAKYSSSINPFDLSASIYFHKMEYE